MTAWSRSMATTGGSPSGFAHGGWGSGRQGLSAATPGADVGLGCQRSLRGTGGFEGDSVAEVLEFADVVEEGDRGQHRHRPRARRLVLVAGPARGVAHPTTSSSVNVADGSARSNPRSYYEQPQSRRHARF